MNAVEKDDFVHALGQTMEFYGKTLDKLQASLWVRAVEGKPVTAIKRALADYTAKGRYAPKPVDILDLIDANKATERAHLPPPKQQPSTCPPEVAKAWMWFLSQIAKDSTNLDGIFESQSDVPLETQERYLHIVNHEARAFNQPEAIPDDYKLKEVWA